MKEPVQDNPMSGDTVGRAAPGEQHRDGEFSVPLGSSRSGRLVFASGASRITVSATPSMADLYRAHFAGRAPHVGVDDGTVTIRYPREPLGEIAINSQVPWDIEIRNGVSRLTADLRGLVLRPFDVRGGASRVELMLPLPSGIVPLRAFWAALATSSSTDPKVWPRTSAWAVVPQTLRSTSSASVPSGVS